MDSESLSIDLTRQSDIEGIIWIAKECNLSYWSKNDYQNEIERVDSFMLSARVEQSVVGFIAARLTASSASSAPTMEPKIVLPEADIMNIGVLPSFQKQGIGWRLLDSFFKECERKDVSNIWLEVRESNVQARDFYRRNRFIEVQKRPGFYSNPTEDAVLLKRKLNAGAEYKKSIKS